MPPPPKPQQQEESTQTDPKKWGPAQYHFTSPVQDMVDFDALQEKILQTLITLSIKELLGTSIELQKHMTGLTKTCREYVDKDNAVIFANLVNDTELPGDWELVCTACASEETPYHCANQGPEGQRIIQHAQVGLDTTAESVESVCARYANAVKSLLPKGPLFAMVTGRFPGEFGGDRKAHV